MVPGDYVGGRFLPPEGEALTSVDPAHELRSVCETAASPARIGEAVAAAKEAYPAWSALSVDERFGKLKVFRAAIEATKEELAEATGLPVQHVDEALGAAQASVSLNQSVGADDEGELGDLFADREAADPFDEAEESLRKQGVRKALDALPERERRILELRFGFEGDPWTLEAIGHELGLTRERVRQLEGQALQRLAALRDLSSVAA